jgi:hypothetical protein
VFLRLSFSAFTKVDHFTENVLLHCSCSQLLCNVLAAGMLDAVSGTLDAVSWARNPHFGPTGGYWMQQCNEKVFHACLIASTLRCIARVA